MRPFCSVTVAAAILLVAACGIDSTASHDITPEMATAPPPTELAKSDPTMVGFLTSLPVEAVLDEVLLTATDEAQFEEILRLAENMGGEIVGHLPEIRLWQVRIANEKADPAVVEQALEQCNLDSASELCFPNTVLSPMGQPTYPDDGYSWEASNDDCACAEAWNNLDIRNQVWGLWAIGMPEAWSLSTGAGDFPISVIDEGMQIGHRDFGDAGVKKFGSSWKNAHGTHVAGILGARGNNTEDIAGVNWHAPLWFYEIQGLWGNDDDEVGGQLDGVPLTAAQSAFVQAAKDDAHLVNYSYGMSWTDNASGKKWCPQDGKSAGGYSAQAWDNWLKQDRQAWTPVMDFVKKEEVLVVAAAGNNSDLWGEKCEVHAKWTGGPQALVGEYPETIISVASVGNPDAKDEYFVQWAERWHSLSHFSSTGTGVEVAAPGAKILSLCQFGGLTCPTSHTRYSSGTSMAAPFVTGLASLVWSLRPDLTPGEVKAKIIAGAKRAGPQVFRRIEVDQPEPVEVYPFHVINAYETLRILDRVTGCTDSDGDGYGIPEDGGGVGLDCPKQETDCDDTDNDSHPGAVEICDDKDNNCNGHVDEENVCKGELAGAPVSGVVPGLFTSDGGTFEISVSPLDKNGDLLFQEVSKENFSFHDIEVATVAMPDNVVATGTAWPEKIEIVPPAQAQETLSVGLLLDSSGSMSSNDPGYERVKAAKAFLGELGPDDRAALFDFGAGSSGGHACVRVLHEFTANKADVEAALGMITADGGTPLYCASKEAVALVTKEASLRRVLVVLTDGESTEDNSYSLMEQAASLAVAGGVTAYTVGLGYSLDFAELQQFAKTTDGTFALASDAQVLSGMFEAVGVASTKGKIIVHGEGDFQPPLTGSGMHLVSGFLRTLIGNGKVDTPFKFGVYFD